LRIDRVIAAVKLLVTAAVKLLLHAEEAEEEP
jgi:hypothetical protein